MSSPHLDRDSAPRGEQEWLELELRWWFPTLSGSVQSSSAGTIGTTLDFERTLGVSTDESFPWGKATLHFADRHRVWVSYLGMSYTGSASLTQPIAYGGITFPAGTVTQSDIDLREIVGAYQYDVLKFSKALVRLELQAHFFDFESKLSGTGVGTATEDFRVVIPTVGGGLDLWPFPWLRVGGDFTVFKLGLSGFEGEMLDGQGGVTVSPWDWLGVSAGYRYFKVIAKDTDATDRVDWLQKGFFGGITVRF